jgi:hypothetical protein
MEAAQHRELLRRAIHDYLQGSASDELEDFEVAFDAVYDTVLRKIADSGEDKRLQDGKGIGFDAEIVAGTALAVACWVGAKLLAAAVADSIHRDFIPRLDVAERQLIEWTHRPELVRKLRDRIEGILRNLSSQK